MKSRAWLPVAMLVGMSATVSAQPQGYGPGVGPGYPGSGASTGEGLPASPWGPAPSMPASPYSREPAWSAPPSDQADAEAADRSSQNPAVQASAVLKEGMDKLLAYLTQEEVPNNLQVAAFLDREIAPYFDFDYMAQWVAGPAFSGMTAEEKKALAAQLESDFLGTLAQHLAGYQGQQIRFLGPRPGPRGAISINVAILSAGGPPTTLQFRMSKSDAGWKVYDVLANGQSAASHYRMGFQRMARQAATALPR
ncbi:MlaC/ttg2D family ABC transporter substrate-binding protein [Thiocystis violacea]|uniref:MlaC/ttg2D family ABC transporter substrate-binding protein n=1 Tax=Thiocystis violacea TaxID=13725 RepID=UPI0019046646|nr:ABC transporter substrate-binding protein [Thiocystis violacea]MBK1718724.1 toluene tolerance protein [Thiocystis violacea]